MTSTASRAAGHVNRPRAAGVELEIQQMKGTNRDLEPSLIDCEGCFEVSELCETDLVHLHWDSYFVGFIKDVCFDAS